MGNFKNWLEAMEKVTPDQQNAQNAVMDAISKVPMKPGQNIKDVIANPRSQMDLLKKAGDNAKRTGNKLNIAAAADTLTNKNGMNGPNVQ